MSVELPAPTNVGGYIEKLGGGSQGIDEAMPSKREAAIAAR